MSPYHRAPHQGGPATAGLEATHAAMLIDFDNVTMGMRSDLSKELKSLLDSDVIKGKVSVQRAYADWRRYPQYIVPLSEASVDLIFAPAYGSNKKNATDIRMAIDAVELVFIRPEIGTYILLTGDSDFSSLVLKLKEYGKYVIGVGIQESSSDILVQNCDEYYSYTSLTGLTKTTEIGHGGRDPWVLVSDALKKMISRKDVMRSDRLKQVMQELDPAFDEGAIGFSKFSKFLAEASSRGLIGLKKLENGQYEVGPSRGRGRGRSTGSDEGRGRRDRERGRGRRGRPEAGASRAVAPAESSGDEADGTDPLQSGYGILTAALEQLRDAGRTSVRDSDVKRKILERDRTFDEAELGFPKFSKFLLQAAEHGVIEVERTDTGNLTVSLAEAPSQPAAGAPAGGDEAPVEVSDATEAAAPPPSDEVSGPVVVDLLPSEFGDSGRRLGPRRGSTRRRGGDEPPPFFQGQAPAVGLGHDASPAASESEAAPTDPVSTNGRQDGDAPESGPSPQGATMDAPTTGDFDAGQLGLPTDPDAIVRYLTHRYKGVGEKTAETLVARFGADLFRALQTDPDSISGAVPAGRAEQVLEAWQSDYARRAGSASGGAASSGDRGGQRGGRRGGRGRSSRGRGQD
jgi:uncharacterized protein (TIGR00288 family)